MGKPTLPEGELGLPGGKLDLPEGKPTLPEGKFSRQRRRASARTVGRVLTTNTAEVVFRAFAFGFDSRIIIKPRALVSTISNALSYHLLIQPSAPPSGLLVYQFTRINQ